jgi:alkyldihydroxyacetonephosphate synthase
VNGTERLLGTLSPKLRARSTTAMPDRVAAARDLWQRRIVEVQHGDAVVAERLPAAVLRPETTDEVVEIVALAGREGLAIVPYGAGSGVCGAIEGGPRTLVLDTKRLRRFEVTEAGTLRAGPGVPGMALEDTLGRRGLTVGHFPSSILCSTVGGWVAARGAGQCSGRYGKVEDMVVSATTVLASGSVTRFQRRQTGLNLLPLLVGSEGTLGVFTELELRLHAAAPERAFTAFELPSTRSGMAVLRRVYQAGLRPAVARLYDPLDSLLMGRHKHGHPASSSVRPWDADKYLGLGRWLARPALVTAALDLSEKTWMRRTKLIFVFEGERGEAHADAEAALAIARDEGGRSLGEEPARHWLARRYAVSYDQSLVFRQGAFTDTLEVAAPWSRLEELYTSVRAALGRHALVMAHLSHAYPDGCSIYFTFLGRSRSGVAVRLHASAWRDAMHAALAAGGVSSHHHGVGRVRAEALGDELGAGGLEVLSRVKRAFDPSGMFCPGSPLGPPRGARVRMRAPSLVPPPLPGDATPGWTVDPVSGLARAPGTMTMSHVERALTAEGRTLGLTGPAPELDVNEFIAQGMPGMPDAFEDPVAQRLAGFAARTHSGLELNVRPAPRRATGPDLSALLVGARGRFGVVAEAWLPAISQKARPARALASTIDPEPGVTAGEREIVAALLAEVGE